jgi:hypothetical protein
MQSMPYDECRKVKEMADLRWFSRETRFGALAIAELLAGTVMGRGCQNMMDREAERHAIEALLPLR